MAQEVKDIISGFVKARLDGNIHGLKDFCFADLEGSGYGCSSGGFDCDNTLLANAIYVLLWGGEGNIFPDLTMENVGSGNNFLYRGDTMNSFRTSLFDAENWPDDDDKRKVANFYRKYHTIGNFVVLPNRPREAGEKPFILNTYRNSKWNDFFDLFLIGLDKVLSGSDDRDAKLTDFVDRSAFRGKTMSELAEALFLGDYMDGEKPKQRFAPHYAKKNKKIDDDEYRNFAMKYIDTATEIISRRAEAICKRLSDLLKI